MVSHERGESNDSAKFLTQHYFTCVSALGSVSGECGLSNSSLQGEDASGTARGFLFCSLAFLSKLPGRKSKNKKLGQRA